MSIYKIKKKYIISSYSIFGGLTVFWLINFGLSKNSIFLLWGLISIAIICIFVLLSKSTIITTDKTIKQSASIFKGGQECTWDKIYKVRTIRSTTTGNYSTYISWAIEPQYENRLRGIFDKNPVNSAIEISDYYEGYVDLLKEVKAKAVNAEIDESTEKIIAGT